MVSDGLLGAAVRKQNGDRFLTGRIEYTGDLRMAGMAHMAVVRSTHAHARIVAIDTERARALPGVIALLTGEEALGLAEPIPHNLDPAGLGGQHAEIRCLAVDRVVYAGEPVAAVVAETAGEALAAARAVTVAYEPLPAVLNAQDALAPDAALLYPGWATNEMIAGETADGDFEQAALDADHVIDGELRIQRTSAAPMEPRTYLAAWDERAQRLSWFGTTQNPHPMRWVLAVALRLSESQVHVVAPPLGGAFGLKMHGHPEELLVAILSRMTGRPVRWAESRAECLLAAGREQRHRYRAAFDADGRIRGIEDELVADHGAAAAGPGWGMAFVASLAVGTGYDVQCCRVTYRVVVTNRAPWSGVRGFGKESANLLMETIVERVAETTGLDPVEVRRRNLVTADRFPYRTATGLDLDSGDYHSLLDKVLSKVGYTDARERQAVQRAAGRHVGIGIAFELTPEGADIPGALVGGYDTTTVKIAPTGHVTVLTGVTSPGNGNETAIAQLVAGRLGVPLELLDVVQGDSSLCPYGYGNLSSRSMITGGGSALLAADELGQKLRTVAARMLEATGPDAVVLRDGFAILVADEGHAIPIGAVAHAAHTLAFILALGIDPAMEATCTYRPPNIRHLPDEHGRISPFASFSNAVHAAIVEVDPETGVTVLRRHVVGHDCGTVVNPAFVDGQVYGSVCAGIGLALTEELLHDADGVLRTDGFKSYLLPRATDLPQIELLHQCTPSPFTALGMKGAGESGLGGAQAAIFNAINDALRHRGARIDALPASPARVFAALAQADQAVAA